MPVSDCNCFRGAASSESWLDVGARRVFPAGKDERYDVGESEECDDNGMAQLIRRWEGCAQELQALP